MRELRTCPVTGRVVLVNDAWVDRPAIVARTEEACWYCADRGPVIARAGAVRVVPHPVPALGVEGDAKAQDAGGAVRREAVGAHELVHGAHEEGEGNLLRMVAARIADLRRDSRLRGFGATRRHEPGRHAVWQVFAVPYDLPGTAPAAWRDREAAAGVRVLDGDDATLTLLAWAPRVPFEAWVMPRSGIAAFGEGDPSPVAEAAARALVRISVALRGPPIDLVLSDGEPWRIEILPRLDAPTAVEAATDLPMHGTFPEAAAAFLRGP